MTSQGCNRVITCLLCLGVKEDQEEQRGQYWYRIGVFVIAGKQMSLAEGNEWSGSTHHQLTPYIALQCFVSPFRAQ